MSQQFLNHCQSRPKMLRHLSVGAVFIFFPCDGDDSGHGGFKNGQRVFVKIEPKHPGEPYHESCRYVCHEYERPEIVNLGNEDAYVIELHGVKFDNPI